MSTGPRTAEGKRAIAEATAMRMASGQQEKAFGGACDLARLAELSRTKHLTTQSNDQTTIYPNY